MYSLQLGKQLSWRKTALKIIKKLKSVIFKINFSFYSSIYSLKTHCDIKLTRFKKLNYNIFQTFILSSENLEDGQMESRKAASICNYLMGNAIRISGLKIPTVII